VTLREIPGGQELRTFSRSGLYVMWKTLPSRPTASRWPLAERVVSCWTYQRPRAARLPWTHQSGAGCGILADGKLLASVSEDKTLRVWQVSSGRELRTILHYRPDCESSLLAGWQAACFRDS